MKHVQMVTDIMQQLLNATRLSVQRTISIIILLPKVANPALHILDITTQHIHAKFVLEIPYTILRQTSAKNAQLDTCIARLGNNV